MQQEKMTRHSWCFQNSLIPQEQHEARLVTGEESFIDSWEPTAASSLDTLQVLLSPHSSSTSPQHLTPGTLSTAHVPRFPTHKDFHSQGIIYGQLGTPHLLPHCTNRVTGIPLHRQQLHQLTQL